MRVEEYHATDLVVPPFAFDVLPGFDTSSEVTASLLLQYARLARDGQGYGDENNDENLAVVPVSMIRIGSRNKSWATLPLSPRNLAPLAQLSSSTFTPRWR